MEVEVSGFTYRVGKLDAFKQLHVSRKLLPLVAQMTAIARKINVAKEGETSTVADMLKMEMGDLMPFAEAIAGLPEADVDTIIRTSCSVVERKLDGDTGWGKIMSTNNVLMFSDIDMIALLMIVAQVIVFNMKGFMGAAGSIGKVAAAMTHQK